MGGDFFVECGLGESGFVGFVVIVFVVVIYVDDGVVLEF